MKRIIQVSLCLLLIVALSVTAFAAGSAQFSVSASAQSVQRGDTVTLNFSLSSSEQATQYGLMLSYDTSVFELVEGSCNASGALVNSFNNGFAFMFQNPTAYSGTVGSVTLKIKDNAPFGSHTVSGSASAKNGNDTVSAYGCSVTVTVACTHSYGAWTESGAGHQQTCSICQDVKKEDHTWDAGTTVKEASCKEGGQVKHTCATCSATKTVDTEKTDDHTYGAWTESGAGHQQTCSVCQNVKTADHTWDAGTTVKEANCKEGGQVKHACTACSATKTVDTEKTDRHVYGNWTKVNDATHKHACSVCQKEETADHSWNSGSVTKKATCKESGEMTYTCTGCGATKTGVIDKLTTHTYDHDCDTDCNVCGLTRTTTHNYQDFWHADQAGHWHQCSVCKQRKDAATHKPGAEPTETTGQTCTVCSYVIKPALGHTHRYATTWTTDDKGHWYACSGCGEKGSYVDHDFENACDVDCSVCGYKRNITHTYSEKWENDAKTHWHVCTVCGEKADEAAHVPGAEATVDSAQTCTTCGYELAPKLVIPETTQPGTTAEPTETTAATQPAVDETPDEDGFDWSIVIALALGVAAASVIFFSVKKKN